MYVTKNLEVENLSAETLCADKITTNQINDISATELSYIKGTRTNLQEQLNKTMDNINKIIDGWK